MKKLVLIECCNFENFITGGQLTFAKHLISCYGENLVLVGISTDNTKVGEWTKKEINGRIYDFFPYLYLQPKSKKPIIPLRFKNYLALKRYKKAILSINPNNVIVQAPDTLLAICNWAIPNICYRFAGTENPLAISRYKIGRILAFLFDRIFLPKLEKIKMILAAADEEAISELVKRSKGKLKRESVIQFPTRINTNVFAKQSKELCRQKINYNSKDLLIVTTGRLGWFKGWKFMIDSFLIFKEQNPNSKLYFVGSGEDYDNVNKYILELNVQDSIVLVGYQTPERIADYLNAADLFIMGSYKEGWSTCLIEAIACGIPSCVTNFSSAKAIIDEGVNGYVVNEHNEDLFAKAMIKTLNIDRLGLPKLEYTEKYSINTLKSDLEKYWCLI